MSLVLSWTSVAVLVLAFLAIEPLHASMPLNGRAEALVQLQQQPGSASPYMVTFQVAENSSSPSPWVLSPQNNRTVWVVAWRLGTPFISQIVNFTIGTKPQVALTLPNAETTSILVDNQRNRVWFPVNDSLAYYDFASKKERIAISFPGGSPEFIAIDGSGRLWATLIASNKIGMYDPSTSQNRTFNVPTPNAVLQGIAVAPDGMIWFAEPGPERLGKLNPATGNVTEYSPSVRLLAPIQLAVAADGVVWFTDHGTNEFGSFNPATGEWAKFPVAYCRGICSVTLPNAIGVDEKGEVWFSEHFAGRIARYVPASRLLTEYIIPVPAGSPSEAFAYAWWASVGQNGLVWFTANGFGEIGYVNSNIPVPLSISTADELTVPEGSSRQLRTTIVYSGSGQVSVGVSVSYLDTQSGTSLISGSYIQDAQFNNNTSRLEQAISIGWNAVPGIHYVTLTASDDQVAVGVPIRLTITTNLLPYLTLTVSLSLLVISPIIYGRRKLRSHPHIKPSIEAAASTPTSETSELGRAHEKFQWNLLSSRRL